MVLNFILFPIFVLIISILGKTFQKFFNLKKNDYVFIDIIYGVFFLCISGLIFNFFFKLHSQIILLFYLFILIYGLNKFLFETLYKIKKKIIWVLILSLLPSLMLPGYDSGLYHLPFQTWIQNEKIIIGMSNLNLRFGITSIFSYASSFLWFENKFLLVSYLSTCFYLVLFLFINEYLSTNYQKLTFGLMILISFPLWSRYVYPSHSLIDDKFGILIIILITLLSINFKKWIFKKEIKREDIFLIGTLFFLIFTFKSSGILFFPLLIVFFIYLIRIKKLLILINPLIFFGFLILAWFIKSFLITGCFYYPVSFSCLDVIWHNSENLDYINEQISLYANSPFKTIKFNYLFFQNLNLIFLLIISLSILFYVTVNKFEKLKKIIKKNKVFILLLCLVVYTIQLLYLDDLRGFSLLLEQQNILSLKKIIFLEIRNITIIFILTFFIPFIFFIQKLNTKILINLNYFVFFIYILGILIIWFFVAPQPRFAYGFIPLITPLFFLSILNTSNKRTNLSEKKYLKFTTLFIIIIFYSKIFNPKINLVYDLHLLPNTITEKRATFGLKPKFQNLCWVEKNCYIFEDKNLVKTPFFNYKYVK